MQIRKDTVVTIDYTLKDNEGNILDTSKGRKPLKYLHGNGNLIPGLENALEGKEVGASFHVVIPPEEAYGPINENLIQEISKDLFEENENLQVGMQFQAQTEQGSYILTIVEVKTDSVVVDGNHPLAGKTLNFDVEVVDVREATKEEIMHGHAH
ncbi:MAG: peptidylprolyl isomerase [Leptonema sp. (in: bacteria)]